MPRLVDYHPTWIDIDDRRGLGLLMDAPAEPGWRLFVLFANPLDGGSPWPGHSRSAILAMFPDIKDREGIIGSGTCRWRREGDTFDTLSLSPSIDAHSAGHFTITNGGW